MQLHSIQTEKHETHTFTLNPGAKAIVALLNIRTSVLEVNRPHIGAKAQALYPSDSEIQMMQSRDSGLTVDAIAKETKTPRELVTKTLNEWDAKYLDEHVRAIKDGLSDGLPGFDSKSLQPDDDRVCNIANLHRLAMDLLEDDAMTGDRANILNWMFEDHIGINLIDTHTVSN